MVRLRLGAEFEAWVVENKKVSIPLWCDCDWFVLLVEFREELCFNPTMVRLRRS